MGNAGIFLRVLDRERVIYEGMVSSVSSVNDKGVFDVLLGHENFISIIKEKLEFVVAGNKQKVSVPVRTGILEAQSDSVRVFLGIGGR